MKKKKDVVLAIIPARSESKSIRKKNIINLAGKPLISYSIKQALRSKYINKVVVSSDSEEILSVAKKYGAEVIKRPKELATSTAKIDGAINHVLNILAKQDYIPNFIVLLQPTSPLRKVATINKAISLFIKNFDKFDSLMPLAQTSNKLGIIKNNQFIPSYQPGIQRQELKNFYYDCGTIHIFKPEIVKAEKFFGKKIFAFPIQWPESLDIDSHRDLELAEYFLNK